MWLIIFPQVIASILIFHIMMIGLLAIKESFASILVSHGPSPQHVREACVFEISARDQLPAYDRVMAMIHKPQDTSLALQGFLVNRF